MTTDEARELHDSFEIARNTARLGSAETDEPTLIGLPDRAVTAAGTLSGKPICQQETYPSIQRRNRATRIKTRIGNHTFRASEP